jgi:hypothetical protein
MVLLDHDFGALLDLGQHGMDVAGEFSFRNVDGRHRFHDIVYAFALSSSAPPAREQIGRVIDVTLFVFRRHLPRVCRPPYVLWRCPASCTLGLLMIGPESFASVRKFLEVRIPRPGDDARRGRTFHIVHESCRLICSADCENNGTQRTR